MMIDEAICAKLSGDAGVSTLVDSRIYPQKGDQGAGTPLVVYSRISAVRWRAMDGASGAARTRIQVDGYARDYITARALAGAIRRCLNDWRDLDVGVLDCSLENEVDFIDDTAEPRLYRVALDFMVAHIED